MRRRLTIYGNWSAYDELSDGVPLTEELAMRQMGELLRIRSSGVRFDAYLMDAFWFDPEGGYRTWRKPNWPDGPGRWLDACAQHGLIPGLWFTANTLCHLNAQPAWLDSADDNKWGLCCFAGGFMADYLDVLDYWYGQGIRIFKLDFADFSAAPPSVKQSMTPEEIRHANQKAYLKAMLGFKRDHPDAMFMGFNGFESKEYMDGTDRPLEPVLDLRWLELFDSIYGGDPRPGDVPAVPLWRSLDIYADHTTRVLLNAGVPAGKIDNCGFMAGPTGTCYWRGKAMWKSMLLLTYARGGDLTVLYGDLSQLDDKDARWMAMAQGLFGDIESVAPFGGIPGRAEPYGWLVDDRLCAVVNPRPTVEHFAVPPGSWSVAFRDQGFDPNLTPSSSSIELGPYQFALLGMGHLSLGMEDGSECRPMTSIPYEVVERSKAALKASLPPGSYRFIVRQRDASGNLVRTYSGTNPASEAISIVAHQYGDAVPVERLDDRVIWSGMSWTIAEIKAHGLSPVTVRIVSHDPNVENIDLEVWAASRSRPWKGPR